MADACIHLMNSFTPTKEQNDAGDVFLNIGTGKDITIKELSEMIAGIV
jgi:GDP-L-fucose synthase